MGIALDASKTWDMLNNTTFTHSAGALVIFYMVSSTGTYPRAQIGGTTLTVLDDVGNNQMSVAYAYRSSSETNVTLHATQVGTASGAIVSSWTGGATASPFFYGTAFSSSLNLPYSFTITGIPTGSQPIIGSFYQDTVGNATTTTDGSGQTRVQHLSDLDDVNNALDGSMSYKAYASSVTLSNNNTNNSGSVLGAGSLATAILPQPAGKP